MIGYVRLTNNGYTSTRVYYTTFLFKNQLLFFTNFVRKINFLLTIVEFLLNFTKMLA